MKETLYIPLGVKPQNEIFTGFGRKELKQSLIGCAIFLAVSFLVYITTLNISVAMVTILVGIGGSIMMCTKDRTNLSVIDSAGNMILFFKQQQLFPYRAKPEWEL